MAHSSVFFGRPAIHHFQSENPTLFVPLESRQTPWAEKNQICQTVKNIHETDIVPKQNTQMKLPLKHRYFQKLVESFVCLSLRVESSFGDKGELQTIPLSYMIIQIWVKLITSTFNVKSLWERSRKHVKWHHFIVYPRCVTCVCDRYDIYRYLFYIICICM